MTPRRFVTQILGPSLRPIARPEAGGGGGGGDGGGGGGGGGEGGQKEEEEKDGGAQCHLRTVRVEIRALRGHYVALADRWWARSPARSVARSLARTHTCTHARTHARTQMSTIFTYLSMETPLQAAP